MKTPRDSKSPHTSPIPNQGQRSPSGAASCGCHAQAETAAPSGFSRRHFLQGLGAAGAAAGALTLTVARVEGASERVPADAPFPRGATLRVKPVLVFDAPTRQDQTSWRSYGGIHTLDAAREEAGRIGNELAALKAQAEFPIQVHPVEVLDSQARLRQMRVDDTDACIVYAAGSCTEWPLEVPMIMFLRHRSGPFYLGLEIANWRFLRQSGDVPAVPGFDADDLVVDSQPELLWRLRALYGVKNAKGTKMLTIGGLAAYSSLAQENGPRVAKEMWGYEFVNVTDEEFTARLKAARENDAVVRQVEEQTAALLKLPNIKLETDRKSVFNSYMAMHVCRELLKETGASNFGFAHCMGRGQITMLGTPACFVLSLANDEGYTAYCHTDLSHTMPGVLLRWIASRPTFVCNSHHPHEGIFLVAHCQAPRRMNGQDYEPATIMTHYESDYGAACKTEYKQDQVVTVVVPNLACSKWQGFRGKVIGSPSYPACRSQMEILADGDWRRLQREMEGFHTQVVYGDYLREVGYALKKVGRQIAWECFS
ncbi:MAG TPA: twin-arginine translocation signal domain-containing protein [Verrucomicrobiota bacterium]|nr:twin-arginine translocation signal domain-containing protein [Verrucomicrobiota bacterium]HRZ35021.1 twin-arginine translocation signal domain-containing protein [Candidatus Paceibacterota bacterium]HRZ54363.1 twin-arginine translocation signal domain-containing protein [Candidatus Paceibacterota bacterium]